MATSVITLRPSFLTFSIIDSSSIQALLPAHISFDCLLDRSLLTLRRWVVEALMGVVVVGMFERQGLGGRGEVGESERFG